MSRLANCVALLKSCELENFCWNNDGTVKFMFQTYEKNGGKHEPFAEIAYSRNRQNAHVVVLSCFVRIVNHFVFFFSLFRKGPSCWLWVRFCMCVYAVHIKWLCSETFLLSLWSFTRPQYAHVWNFSEWWRPLSIFSGVRLTILFVIGRPAANTDAFSKASVHILRSCRYQEMVAM